MENLSFDQKITLLAMAKNAKEKSALIDKFSSNAEFYLGFNARTMPLKQYMDLKREKFKHVVAKAKTIRDNIKNKGWTDKKYQRYWAELPEDLFLERPEFNAHLPQKTLTANIRAFLADYPMFRVDKWEP